MKLQCPNKKDPQWIKLVAKVGEKQAMKLYLKNNQEIPDPDTIDPLKIKESIKSEERYLKQLVLFNNRIKRLSNISLKYDKNTKEYKDLQVEIQNIKDRLDEINKTKNTQIIIDMGNEFLDRVDNYIDKVETGKINITKDKSNELDYAIETVDTFKEFIGTSDKTLNIEKRLNEVLNKAAIDAVNYYKTEKDTIDLDKITNQTSDINRFTKGLGALVDVADYLARTIGSMIKSAQNKISTLQNKLADEIKEEVNLLRNYSNSIGIDEKDMYKTFIQDFRGTTVLTKEYTSQFYEDVSKAFKEKNWVYLKSIAYKDEESNQWLPINKTKYRNPNWIKIQKSPELKRFYDFYKKTIVEAQNKLPIALKEDFIPNIKKNSLVDIIKSDKSLLDKFKDGVSSITNINSNSNTKNDFIGEEELYSDIVPLKYIQKLTSEEKVDNLGEALYKFSAFAISHEEMSDILPKARVLQRVIAKKHYTKSSDPSIRIWGDQTNIYKMVDTIIDMQIKGKKKLNEAKIPTGNIYDENGDKIGEKYIYGSDVIDFGLKYNSLLRIGLNPINAVTNVFTGDFGNIIEGFGGRYFKLKHLTKATDIFFKENFNGNSKMNKLLETLNPLQELEDYQHSDQLKFKKKLDSDKLKNILYYPQKAGEKYLQARTMIAIMLKEEINDNKGNKVSLWDAFDEDGKLKKEFANKFNSEELDKFLTHLTDKIQRVNQLIHGRYSERDAATIQQGVLGRMLFQFKKWIPSAIEQRFGKEQYDVRLQENIEGRYRTAWRLLTKDLKGTLQKLKSGNLTELEIYNMRKNLIELVIIAGTISLYFGLKWDDDDEKQRNPYYKLVMQTLDRTSGDLLFWYNPTETTRLVKNPIALAKTTEDVIKVFTYLPYAFDWEDGRQNYKSGANKDKNKLYISLAKIIPGIKPVQQVVESFSKEKYKEQ